MQQARYLETLIHLASEDRFGQDAIEWAIIMGRFKPSYDNLQADLRAIFEPLTPPLSNCCASPPRGKLDANSIGFCGNCGNGAVFKPETRYDQICEDFRRACRDNEAALQQAMEDTGLLEEILRPVPLHEQIT